MKLTGLHILLTYKCVYECDHCFVWGSPRQSGVLTLGQLDIILEQAVRLGTIRELYFEGGETFVYYPVLITAVRRAGRHFKTAVVTNGYWATSIADANNWLKRLADVGLRRIEFSLDEFHDAGGASELHPGVVAARELGLETRVLRVSMPKRGREACDGDSASNNTVMFRGRAAANLTEGLPRKPWKSFTTCPFEDLSNPTRVHVDPFGYVHLCQGLVIGNLFQASLTALAERYVPEAHPIVGPLIAGGPAQLVRHYRLQPESGYVDACHLCYAAREQLRSEFPSQLGPNQMYGVKPAPSSGEVIVVPD
jgi:hypothetical protein